MDLLRYDGASIEEDRISNLPDDIIHRILSFLDMRYAIQTCILSLRWKNTWTSMPYINLNSCMFKPNRKFAKFVKHVLTHRNNRTDVFGVELRLNGQTDQMCVEDIVNYAYLYNARKLTMIWSNRNNHLLPQYLFSSRTLKHLTLDGDSPCLTGTYLPESAWDLPALETLKLSKLRLDDPGNKRVNLFSKCVNLKDLTLHGVYMHGWGIFNVCAPQLLNLTIMYSVSFPKVFNVVAPQLKNLTASLSTYPYRNGPPLFLPLSTESFNSLEKVNLSFGSGPKEQRHGSQLLNLFQIICKAKFLNLDVDIIENLSNSCPDQLSCEPCPFNNLKCLKINAKPLKQNKRIATIPVQIKNYFLQNSRSATFIVDYHQVPQKRLREQVPNDTMPKKVAKLDPWKNQAEIPATEKKLLEEKPQVQDQVVKDQKAMFEELELKHKKLMSHIIEFKMAELKVLVESKSPDCEVIRSKYLREAVKARFSSLFYSLESLLLMHIDASPRVNIEREPGNITHSNNSQSQSDASDADLPLAPSPSSANVATSLSLAWLESNTDIQPSRSSRE